MSPTDREFPELASEKEWEDQDFQAVLKALLDAYRPFLEKELKRAKSPKALQEEAKESPPDCDREIALADSLFDPFLTEQVALSLVGPQAREELASVPEWAWCWRHIICCLKFGWLLGRARSFQAAAYYLNRYWYCVRQVLDIAPVDRDLTDDERSDLEALTTALAEIYKAHLGRQLDSLVSPEQLSEHIIAGKIDCEEGLAEADQVFDQFLTPAQAQALLGKEAFAKYSQSRIFWFCRCWCLCSIRFGYCLARAKSLLDALRCLIGYFRCVRRCWRPLTCELTAPTDCMAEEVNTALPALVVEVRGTAAGANFDHYVLEWSSDGSTWHASDFHYPPIPPGGGTQGNTPVYGGLLGLFDTSARDEGSYEIRMTVYSVQGTTRICTTRFSLFKQDVRILGVDGVFSLDAPALDPAARLIETVPALCTRPAGTFEVSFADCLRVWGSAFVGGCEERKIKRYALDYKPGFETNPTTPGWTNFWNVDYNTIWQYRDVNMRKDTSVLTARWDKDCIINVPFPPYCLHEELDALLKPSCWQTKSSTCGLSGLFTLRLMVEDTLGNFYYDTQRAWIDNKPICAMIRIDAVPKCQDIYLSQFAQPPDCSVPWNLPISGIAYDEYIDPTLPLTRPNDNFDFYWVKVKKQGSSEVQIPIPGPTGTCFYGTSRVGNPGTTCVQCDPANPDPSAVFGTLAQFDLRAVDPICSASVGYALPANFTIPRGECCTYLFTLHVQDRTVRSAGPHWREDTWPVRICNDLRSP